MKINSLNSNFDANIGKVSFASNVSNSNSSDFVTQKEFVSSPTSNALKSYAVSHIELQKLRKLQKTFQDVFLNPDISIGEAKIMLDRYKELEKIEDKTEYTRAVFEEVKRNFGFKNSKIELEIAPKETMKGYVGSADQAFTRLQIREDVPKESILETIHHEFRHFKQHYLSYKYSPELYRDAVAKRIETVSGGKVKNAWRDLNKFIEWINQNIGEDVSMSTIPPQYKTFAQKCLKATENYVYPDASMAGYWDNFAEEDARYNSKLIAKLIKSK